MAEQIILVCTLVGTVAAVISLLPLFGFDIRIFGRSDNRAEALLKTGDRREKRLWLALAIVVLSFGMSAGALYYFVRPRTIDKVVEKDKAVAAQQPCPIPYTKTKERAKTTRTPAKGQQSDSLPAPSSVTASGGSIAIGAVSGTQNTVTPTVNNFAVPSRHLSPAGIASLADFAKTLPADLSDTLTVRTVNESEPIGYGEEIKRALEQHTKVQFDVGLSWANIPHGVYVCATSESAPIFPLAQKIVLALSAAGVQQINFMRCDGVDDKHTMIIVGVRVET